MDNDAYIAPTRHRGGADSPERLRSAKYYSRNRAERTDHYYRHCEHCRDSTLINRAAPGVGTAHLINAMDSLLQIADDKLMTGIIPASFIRESL